MLDVQSLVVLPRDAPGAPDGVFDLCDMVSMYLELVAEAAYLAPVHDVFCEPLYFGLGDEPIGALDEHFPDCETRRDVEVWVVDGEMDTTCVF